MAYERYIAVSNERYGGFYGYGEDQKAALAKLKLAGGKPKLAKLIRFTSELPFAPTDRPATEQEADAWMDRYGGLNYIRTSKPEYLS